MFLVLEEDTCLYVYASPGEAAADIEALDVDTVRAAFERMRAHIASSGSGRTDTEKSWAHLDGPRMVITAL